MEGDADLTPGALPGSGRRRWAPSSAACACSSCTTAARRAGRADLAAALCPGRRQPGDHRLEGRARRTRPGSTTSRRTRRRVEMKGGVRDVRARAEGEERERIWKKAAAVWPDYDSYQRRAPHRKIPVVVLDRARTEPPWAHGDKQKDPVVVEPARAADRAEPTSHRRSSGATRSSSTRSATRPRRIGRRHDHEGDLTRCPIRALTSARTSCASMKRTAVRSTTMSRSSCGSRRAARPRSSRRWTGRTRPSGERGTCRRAEPHGSGQAAAYVQRNQPSESENAQAGRRRPTTAAKTGIQSTAGQCSAPPSRRREPVSGAGGPRRYYQR